MNKKQIIIYTKSNIDSNVKYELRKKSSEYQI